MRGGGGTKGERGGCVYGKEESWERWGDRELRHRQRKRKVGVRVNINKKFTSFMYSVHVHVHAYTCRLFVKLSFTYLRSPRSAQSTGRLLTLQRSQSGSTSPLLTSSIRHNLQPRHNPAQLPSMCTIPSMTSCWIDVFSSWKGASVSISSSAS